MEGFGFLFEPMRETTKEEQESINNHISSISIPTGLNIFDILEQFDKEGEINE